MYTTRNAAWAFDVGEADRNHTVGVFPFAAGKATWMALEAIRALGGNG